ncbi:MAG: prenyltransferase [Alphaproteobacteria bacterium]|nr:prenyltransferase [Alphaproteobacteria bacterium]
MSSLYLTTDAIRRGFFAGAVARIRELQRADGSIPWFDGGVFDPWNHTEAAMGLVIAGETAAALRAYRHLADEQQADGSWLAEYGAAVPLENSRYEGGATLPLIRDTNFAAYVATGIWHYVLATGDRAFAREMWPMVEKAIDFVLDHQYPEGDIRWAGRDPHTPEEDALVTGCASIYKSLECAVLLARSLGADRPDWARARARLGEALRDKPHRFDRQWESKSHFSMDWYYPVLAGALRGPHARARIEARWGEFVEEGKGCRCVTGQPWVTIAETCELVMALLMIGDSARARDLFGAVQQWRDQDGSYWMGYQYAEDVPWPVEKPAWTAGAVLLAADALTGATGASRLFTTVALEEAEPQAGTGRGRRQEA